MIKTLVSIACLFLLISCNSDHQTGPVSVKWDRDACDRCQMMLSERNYAAQIRVFSEEKRSKVYKFDDFGCAVLWLDKYKLKQKKSDNTVKDNQETEFWVSDHTNKQWINARNAWYIKGAVTPMGYGLGAQAKKNEDALNYEQAVGHIYVVEKKYNIHGGNLKH